jgi:hypothetical protein
MTKSLASGFLIVSMVFSVAAVAQGLTNSNPPTAHLTGQQRDDAIIILNANKENVASILDFANACQRIREDENNKVHDHIDLATAIAAYDSLIARCAGE